MGKDDHFIRNNMLGKALGTENGEHGTSLWGRPNFIVGNNMLLGKHWKGHFILEI
jgi:hypothetical protein